MTGKRALFYWLGKLFGRRANAQQMKLTAERLRLRQEQVKTQLMELELAEKKNAAETKAD